MVLNLQQQAAVAKGEPVALNVAGTDRILVRRDVYLRLDPDFETGPWTIEEMNLLADEAEELISQKEAMKIERGHVINARFPHASGPQVSEDSL
jgi:propanediol utilization protein